MTNHPTSRPSRHHELTEIIVDGAELLDRIAEPMFGDVPQYAGPERQEEPVSLRLCPLCSGRMCDHWIEYVPSTQKHYLHCPGSDAHGVGEY